MSTTRRRSLIAKPNFQIKLTIIFMLIVTIVANLVGGLTFFFMTSPEARATLRSMVTNPENENGLPGQEVGQLFIKQIMVAEGISLMIVFMLCIWVTHTIAGPLYRMERVANDIGEGDLSIFTRLRPKDELKELADAFNVMSRRLAQKIYAVKDAVRNLEELGDIESGIHSVRASLEVFRLPERGLLDSAQVADEDLEDSDEGDVTNLADVTVPAPPVPVITGASITPTASVKVATVAPQANNKQQGKQNKKKRRRG
jgi:methyl-accepting chemotaxis protein